MWSVKLNLLSKNVISHRARDLTGNRREKEQGKTWQAGVTWWQAEMVGVEDLRTRSETALFDSSDFTLNLLRGFTMYVFSYG